MTYHHFVQLNMEEKTEAVEEGVFLHSLESSHYTLLLYQVDDFYAEVVYDNNRDEVMLVHSFCSTALLDPYLVTIDISTLLATCF